MSAQPVPYRMGALCWFGVHIKTRRRRWFSPCRSCGLPLAGPKSRPITDHVLLHEYHRVLALDPQTPERTVGARIYNVLRLLR